MSLKHILSPMTGPRDRLTEARSSVYLAMILRKIRPWLTAAALATAACGSMSSIMGARFYRLSEQERKVYVGLKGIDSTTAVRYITMETSPERTVLYDSLFGNKPDERKVFERRIEEAFHEFGRVSPMLDDRLPIYVRYGPPPGRRRYDQTKTAGMVSRIMIKPSEIWRYPSEGLEFDFIRLGRAFKLIARSEFGSRIAVPSLRESELVPPAPESSSTELEFDLAYGRFRQSKNLTRLELYLSVPIPDTAGTVLRRDIQVYSHNDSLVDHKTDAVQPVNSERGPFLDEVNLWLEPREYRVIVTLTDPKHHAEGRREFKVNLLEYAEDVKEISDLVPASLIDESFTAEKFQKPIGRVIPLIKAAVPVHQPFYFYHEVYNLQTEKGMHHIHIEYQIYNLKVSRNQPIEEEVVDVLLQEIFGEGDVAFMGAIYHPMDLLPGRYMIVVRDKDLLSGKERSALGEFELIEKK